jgi:hypothetical protein
MTLIQKLAEQAKNSIPKDSLGVTEWIAAYNQKFAELIVRECAEVADIADKNESEWTGGNILTHFGIKP